MNNKEKALGYYNELKKIVDDFFAKFAKYEVFLMHDIPFEKDIKNLYDLKRYLYLLRVLSRKICSYIPEHFEETYIEICKKYNLENAEKDYIGADLNSINLDDPRFDLPFFGPYKITDNEAIKTLLKEKDKAENS